LPYPAISFYIILFNNLVLIRESLGLVYLAITDHISRNFTNKLRTNYESTGGNPLVGERLMATIRRLKSKKFLADIRKLGQYQSRTFTTKVQAMAWAPSDALIRIFVDKEKN
jgi:hypothetical protein